MYAFWDLDLCIWHDDFFRILFCWHLRIEKNKEIMKMGMVRKYVFEFFLIRFFISDFWDDRRLGLFLRILLIWIGLDYLE